jgi:hypothetical protein
MHPSTILDLVATWRTNIQCSLFRRGFAKPALSPSGYTINETGTVPPFSCQDLWRECACMRLGLCLNPTNLTFLGLCLRQTRPRCAALSL